MPHTNPEPKIRVLCADDHALVRKGIASILANESDIELVGEAGNGREALELFRRHRPDITLMDLRMPEMDGTSAVLAIRAEFPEARIIALTSFDGDHDVFKAVEAGVQGYMLKEMVHTEVLRAIRSVHTGRQMLPAKVAERLSTATLTPREIEVLGFVAKGFSNKEIAQKLGTADGTVKMHVQNILAKLDAADRAHAVSIAVRRGIIQLQG
jgi:DNA-binding NarL/FixJ family response regulator